MDNYFEPRQILTILFKWWWVPVLMTVMAIAIGYGITQRQTPVYEGTATVMVGGFIQSPQINRDDIVARDAFTEAYAEMARRQPVLEGVVDALELGGSWRQLAEYVTVNVIANTPLIEIRAQSNNPQNAQAIAGEIANQLILLSQNQNNDSTPRPFVEEEIENLQIRIETGRDRLTTLQLQATYPLTETRQNEIKVEIDTLQRFITDWEDTLARLLALVQPDVSQNRLAIIEEAHANPKPVSPNLTLNILLSACIGFGLSLGIIFMIDLFDDRIRSSKALDEQLGLKHLGTISKMRGKDYDGKLISSQNPLFGTTLFYRRILNNIGLLDSNNQSVKSLVVTSPRVREGKSLTVSNLGIVMAQAGKKTIIVDVDWKQPVQHVLFDIPNKTGLMDLLSTSSLSTDKQLIDTGIPNLQILPTGNLPEDPQYKLEEERLRQVLADLAKISDVVILDSPSTEITESTVLFGLVDGVVLVIDSDQATMTSVKKSMTSLYLTGGKVLGGIVNRSPAYWGIS